MSYTFKSNRRQVMAKLSQAEERALLAIGLFVEGEASVRAPVDTGNLRASYTHQVDATEKSVAIGTPVEYGPYVEFGTSRQTEQPHLVPAVEENLGKIRQLVNRELGGIG